MSLQNTVQQAPQSFEPHSDFITDARDTGNGYYLIGRQYPSKHMELTAIRLETDDSLKNGGGAKRKNKERGEMDAITANKSSARARITVRRKLMSFEADRLLTLTFKQNVTDLDDAWKYFKAFNKKMRLKFGERWSYVVVPELQERGAVHFHLAIKGFYHANTIRAIWRSVTPDRKGNIDFTSPRKHAKNSWHAKSIASYISKYITKGDTVSFNRKRYGASSNISLPEPIRGWLALGFPPILAMQMCVEKMSRKNIDKNSIFEFEAHFPIIYLST